MLFTDEHSSHAHIYGIDLVSGRPKPSLCSSLGQKCRSCILYADFEISQASPSELIAHDRGGNRALEDIARHIGADKVIFQDLEDLKASCSDAVISKSTPEEERDFEVGVFCGKYVTPVTDEYFQHLEEVRGETRKMKVLEKAREAVANGWADQEELEIATKGIKVAENGKLVPASGEENRNGAYIAVNGGDKRRKQSREEKTPPKDQMDISLHNYGDF